MKWNAQVRQQLFPGQASEEEVSDREYVDYVRQFRQSEMVSLVAAAAPSVSFNQATYTKTNRVTPWGLADIARVSLAFGSERNRLSPTGEHLDRCLQMHNSLGHPGLAEKEPNALAHALLQLAFSQFSFQRDVGPLIGRSIALFNHTEPADPTQMEVLHGDWQTDLLGCSLINYIGVTQLMMAAAAPNQGRFDPSWIERDDLTDLTDIFDPAVTRHVLHTYLVAPASTFRERDPGFPSIDRRFTFNPLIDTPVVAGLGPSLLMPVPDYLIGKPTTSGLYYTGLSKWGVAFAHDVGRLFEAYVGRQLALIPGVQVYPEITYRHEKDLRKSIDWIVVFPNLVLLVEVKAARPTEALRAGAEGSAAALQQAFNKGHKQLGTTFDLIQARVAEFAHIPTDRPTVGVVVTLEDFHVANSILHLPMYSPSPKLPTLAVAVEELEGIVCLGPATEAFLRDQLNRPPGQYANLRQALSTHNIPANPILAAGVADSPINRVNDTGAK